MNDMRSMAEAEACLAAVLPAEAPLELEWAQVLDCGALGPSRAEPRLFHQDPEGWDYPCASFCY